MGVRYFGASVMRSEDPRLLTGNGRYVDDIALPGMLHGAFARSEHAHARIRSIDVSAAAALPGVHAVLTQDDAGAALASKRMVQVYPHPKISQDITQYPLARDEVCFVGQTVALVVADSRHIAEDAATLVDIDYEPLPAAADWRRALDTGAPRVHEGRPDNRAAELGIAFGDAEQAFANAPHAFTVGFEQHRGACHAMETRGVLAHDDPYGAGLTVHCSTQAPYLLRRALARYLELDENRVTVIAPDVGGGFGPKAGVYAEDMAVAMAARLLARPVKWIEDRREHFTATNQQGDMSWSLEIAADGDGRILGVRGRVLLDMGAYVSYGLLLPFTTLNPLPGPYAIPALDVKLDAVFTNKTCTSPVRGAGRPNAAYAMERVVETVARNLGIDPVEVRRRNFVRADQFPYQPGHKLPNGNPVTYDSGDFHGCLDKALELSDHAGFAARQAVARADGRYLGIGVSSCVEDTGVGPYEGVTVRVQPSGKVLVQTGAASQGQGHETVFSQIVAERLGIDIADVVYRAADTGAFPLGVGTVASRVVCNAGPAAHGAATAVREKALAVAAGLLEVAVEDLDIDDGLVHVQGDPGRNVTLSLGEIALRLSPMTGGAVPAGFTPGLEATSYTASQGSPHASGTNVAEVEVDVGTGEVRVLKYSVAHDCGRMINPMLVDGQIIGGVVHGIGNALFERMVYDAAGQPLSTNYGEYLLPLASEMPAIGIVHQETPSPLNALGVKGAGEGGTIPAASAVIAAVENALAPFGVVIDDHPVDPQRICELIDAATAKAG